MSNPTLQLADPAGAKKSNLAFALRALPRDRREDALTFYAFCRAVDDIADDPARSTGEKTRLLSHWKTSLQTNADLPPALATLIQRRELDPRLFHEIILGVEMDIEPRHYATSEDLRAYCWRVACAVGLVSIRIFGCKDPASTVYAEHLGHALQLTNILRDVAEDAALGRIYLPIEDLHRFHVSESSLLAGKPDGDFPGLMNHEATRARELFQQARQALPPADARALVPAEAMRAIYEKILHRMTADHFRVFEKRYRLPLWQKVLLLGQSYVRR